MNIFLVLLIQEQTDSLCSASSVWGENGLQGEVEAE